jgi:hypothetical protein
MYCTSFSIVAQNVLELRKLIFAVEGVSRPRLFELSEILGGALHIRQKVASMLVFAWVPSASSPSQPQSRVAGRGVTNLR